MKIISVQIEPVPRPRSLRNRVKHHRRLLAAENKLEAKKTTPDHRST
jgi:hypothetical protein